MMILQHSCFLHVPKTGGNWVRHAIKSAVPVWRENVPDGNQHLTVEHCPPGLFRFAFVRQPTDLYRSYWQFKMGAGWDPASVFDQVCGDEDFSGFVMKSIKIYPGICGAMFEAYVGREDNEIEFIGRQESIVDDLVRALSLAGEKFDERIIRAQPPVNVSDRQRFPADYSEEARRGVLESEWRAMKRFGYAERTLRLEDPGAQLRESGR